MNIARHGSDPPDLVIDGRSIGPEAEPFIVAEMSGNHNGSLDRALEIVDAVAASGAHALKLQTYTADTLTIDVDSPPFRISEDHPLWGGAKLYDLFERAHTPWEWHAPIFERARERGLAAFSSPFDASAIELLEELDVPAYKIASSEIVDLPLIRQVAETGKPIILSTGMARLSEIDAAVSAVREGGNDVLVLGCTTSYPAPPADSNLRSLPVLADAFGTIVGLSDHTEGIGVAVASVALGACLIEKHVTLSRIDGGVDSEFSLEPAELAQLVEESKRAWESLGDTRVGPTGTEAEGLRFRRSLYVVRDVTAGDEVTRENVRSIRPSGGLPPDELETVLGRRFAVDATKGTPLSWDLL